MTILCGFALSHLEVSCLKHHGDASLRCESVNLRVNSLLLKALSIRRPMRIDGESGESKKGREADAVTRRAVLNQIVRRISGAKVSVFLHESEKK
jgi:hypothetical protein